MRGCIAIFCERLQQEQKETEWMVEVRCRMARNGALHNPPPHPPAQLPPLKVASRVTQHNLQHNLYHIAIPPPLFGVRGHIPVQMGT